MAVPSSSPRFGALIAGTGCALPEKRLTNADLEKTVETTDDWIVQRTGRRERRVVSAGETTSTLAIEAARKALADAEISPEQLDLIIVCTLTPDMLTPATACIVQHGLGIQRHIGAM